MIPLSAQAVRETHRALVLGMCPSHWCNNFSAVLKAEK